MSDSSTIVPVGDFLTTVVLPLISTVLMIVIGIAVREIPPLVAQWTGVTIRKEWMYEVEAVADHEAQALVAKSSDQFKNEVIDVHDARIAAMISPILNKLSTQAKEGLGIDPDRAAHAALAAIGRAQTALSNSPTADTIGSTIKGA